MSQLTNIFRLFYQEISRISSLGPVRVWEHVCDHISAILDLSLLTYHKCISLVSLLNICRCLYLVISLDMALLILSCDLRKF